MQSQRASQGSSLKTQHVAFFFSPFSCVAFLQHTSVWTRSSVMLTECVII